MKDNTFNSLLIAHEDLSDWKFSVRKWDALTFKNIKNLDASRIDFQGVELNFYETPINLTCLERFQNIKILSLKDCSLTSVDFSFLPPNVEELNLQDNKIEKIKIQ